MIVLERQNASKFLRFRLCLLFLGCYVYSYFFWHSLSVFPVYSFPHEHLPRYITQEGCRFLLLILIAIL